MSIERFFASPLTARIALHVVIALAVLMCVIVGAAAAKSHQRDTDERPCALVLTRSGHECR